MMTSTFDKIYANAQNMNIETSEWFNRAGFFWCQCTEKQLQKMRAASPGAGLQDHHAG